jgi:hypothetical protein
VLFQLCAGEGQTFGIGDLLENYLGVHLRHGSVTLTGATILSDVQRGKGIVSVSIEFVLGMYDQDIYQGAHGKATWQIGRNWLAWN